MLDERNTTVEELDTDLATLSAARDMWAKTGNKARIQLLKDTKDCLHATAEGWVDCASRKKGIPVGSPLKGEDWLTGIFPVMAACNGLIDTLQALEDGHHLENLSISDLPNGQIAVKVLPNTLMDRLVTSNASIEVWMQPGVTRENLAQNAAQGYAVPADHRTGKVALILGAGNVASIAPLDCFQKLFIEHQVCLLKMNLVNAYLADHLKAALRPLIDIGVLRIASGDLEVGKYLTNHKIVEEIHITGAESSYNAILWGVGEEGRKNKTNNAPQNPRPISAELGGVSPTIVVPGPWSKADLCYHGELIATQKLNNSGFNCIACQMLVLPAGWVGTDSLMREVQAAIKRTPGRPAYYPGADDRLEAFKQKAAQVVSVQRDTGPSCIIVPLENGENDYFETQEVFAPALSVRTLDAPSAEEYMRTAIRYANEKLHGTLAANILIHPKTLAELGAEKFDSLLAELRYGTIAVNSWAGIGFALTEAPWGAFPGHTQQDIQSGIGTVHNSYMFDKPERTVIRAPFRMRPRPAWFVTNREQESIGRNMVQLTHKPNFWALLRLVVSALRG